MSDAAIRVDHLSKAYRLGEGNTLRATLGEAWRRRRNGDHPAEPSRLVWALRDASFEVKRGEVVGVVGANGAGKSTLLKILARITKPTEGRVEIRGRVGALLEVGTGFHAELTGRENVYLNATILGMRQVEIDRKLELIAAFAGVGRFLDVPLKFYSSGMQVRLAFSVAAHLEPEILLIDEALAVGDAAFQAQCSAKMRDLRAQGRTILVVSHDLGSLGQLATRCLLITGGVLVKDGPTADTIAEYLRLAASPVGTPV